MARALINGLDIRERQTLSLTRRIAVDFGPRIENGIRALMPSEAENILEAAIAIGR